MKKLLILGAATLSSLAQSNVTGSDLQNFNAITSGLDFVTVQSSETLVPGIANFGLFGNYAINTLPRLNDQEEARSGSIRDSVIATDFNFGLGLTKTIDIGFSIPSIVSQDVKQNGARGEFDNTGITEIRANLKWRFLGGSDGGMAVITSINQNLTKNNPFTGSGSGPIFNFELAMDYLLYSTAIGFNIGYRLRSPGDPVPGFPIEPLEDQVISSAAISQLIPSIDTKLILEIFTATPLKETNTGSTREVSASELLLGAKYDLNRNLSIHVGGSTELDHGTASPDWRAYTGINYVTGNYSNKKVKLVRKKKKRKKKKIVEVAPVFEPEPVPLPVIPDSINVKDDLPPEHPGIGDEVFVLRDVNFAFDSAYKVVAGAKSALDNLGNHLLEKGFSKVIIEGHTDSLGSEDYNTELGRQRAETIKQYLVKVKNLDSDKIKVLTYGEFRPLADNGNYQGRQINRRVVFRIIY